MKKYNDYITSYKTIKTSLKSIVKKEIDIDKINEAVIRTNLIITHTYQFLKLYYLVYLLLFTHLLKHKLALKI